MQAAWGAQCWREGPWGVIRPVTARITQLSLLRYHLSWVGEVGAGHETGAGNGWEVLDPCQECKALW